MPQPNVVSLSTGGRKAGLPPILHALRQHSKKYLLDLLQRLFNNVDDALFEMADRSNSDVDQNMYFDSMREIRLNRERILSEFVKRYQASFESLFTTTHADDTEANAENLSLLQNDELEVAVAIGGIVSKVTSQHSLAIMQLTRRVDHLCTARSVTERLNPFGPQQLSQAFAETIECLNINIKVRIILLKLFERFVMERLAPLYAESNAMLADAGVLPDLKDLVRSGRNRAAASKSRTSGPARAARRTHNRVGAGEGATGSAGSHANGEIGESGYGKGQQADGRHGTDSGATFGVIQRLLAASHVGQLPADGPSMSQNDLLSVLSAAQTDLSAPINIEEIPRLLDLHHVVRTRAPDVTGQALSRLDQSDNDVVNFVGMLFDYILNDRNLAIPMKALIGRLQLPIVKLAVMDKSFFEKPNHPARQLLNELSSAGIGWSSAAELKRDAVYNKIESIVLRVMNGFTDNPQIFQELIEELRQFVSKDRRKRQQLEQRVKETESGKAKRMVAKERVQKLINQKASGMRLPPDVGRFISDTWSKVLVYAAVSDGEHSPLWQESAQTLDELLWCLQPLDNLQDVERRDAMIETLLGNLSRGMSKIKLPPETCTAHHDRIYAHLHDISHSDRAFLEDDEPRSPIGAYQEMEEIVLTPPEEHLDPVDLVPPEPEYLEQISRLSEGVWVEIIQEDGEKLRCKLAAVVEPGPRYVFVNRRGMKVLEKSRMGLAVDLKRKSLTVLAESQVFDRALQAVIGNLRTMHGNPAPNHG